MQRHLLSLDVNLLVHGHAFPDAERNPDKSGQWEWNTWQTSGGDSDVGEENTENHFVEKRKLHHAYLVSSRKGKWKKPWQSSFFFTWFWWKLSTSLLFVSRMSSFSNLATAQSQQISTLSPSHDKRLWPETHSGIPSATRKLQFIWGFTGFMTSNELTVYLPMSWKIRGQESWDSFTWIGVELRKFLLVRDWARLKPKTNGGLLSHAKIGQNSPKMQNSEKISQLWWKMCGQKKRFSGCGESKQPPKKVHFVNQKKETWHFLKSQGNQPFRPQSSVETLTQI